MMSLIEYRSCRRYVVHVCHQDERRKVYQSIRRMAFGYRRNPARRDSALWIGLVYRSSLEGQRTPGLSGQLGRAGNAERRNPIL